VGRRVLLVEALDQAAEQQESEDAARGRRAEVLGGRQLDGFATVCEEILMEAGVPEKSIYFDHEADAAGVLPRDEAVGPRGDPRGRTPRRDRVPVDHEPFGNNLNNRTEEALGSPTDLYGAYEEGAYDPRRGHGSAT